MKTENVTMENHQFTETSKTQIKTKIMAIQTNEKANNMMAVMYLNISNHSKLKWIKFTNQKAQSGWVE